jgi:hypothetical protein
MWTMKPMEFAAWLLLIVFGVTMAGARRGAC